MYYNFININFFTCIQLKLKTFNFSEDRELCLYWDGGSTKLRIPIPDGKIKLLTYISLRPYRQERLCRTPGSWRYASLVMSSTPDGRTFFNIFFKLFLKLTLFKFFSKLTFLDVPVCTARLIHSAASCMEVRQGAVNGCGDR